MRFIDIRNGVPHEGEEDHEDETNLYQPLRNRAGDGTSGLWDCGLLVVRHGSSYDTTWLMDCQA